MIVRHQKTRLPQPRGWHHQADVELRCALRNHPRRRTVQRRIENELAKRVLAGEFREGQTVTVDFADGAFQFSATGSATEAAASAA